MIMKNYVELLTQNGFVPADQKKDFGYNIPYVYYALRKRGNLYEYVSLMSYGSEFCEAFYEAYVAEKNTYRPKGTPKVSELMRRGFNFVVGGLPRSFESLSEFVLRTEAELQAKCDSTLEAQVKLEKEKKS